MFGVGNYFSNSTMINKVLGWLGDKCSTKVCKPEIKVFFRVSEPIMQTIIN